MPSIPDAARLCAAAAGVLFCLATPAQAPANPPSEPAASSPAPQAVLAGHALLPVDTSVPSPKGFVPRRAVAVRGITGLVPLRRDEFIAVVHPGKAADVPLALHRLSADWTQGRVKPVTSFFLRDPARTLAHPLRQGDTRDRFLTGADLHPQSAQVIDQELWVGDDLGPYILRFDMSGKALGRIDPLVGKQVLRGPDTPEPAPTHAAPVASDLRAQRDAGLGGLALSIDGSRVYPILSAPLWNEATQSIERINGQAVVRILEVDTAKREYTGRYRYHALAADHHRVSDFQMLDATTGVLIERDDLVEAPAAPCAVEPASDCPPRLPTHKRLVKIDLAKAGADRVVRKVASVDLLRIANPRQLARTGLNEATFGLPHAGIDALALVNGTHAVVINNNRDPAGGGRPTGEADDSEFTLLDLGELLQAR